MPTDPIERLRRSNPVPSDITPPPIELVLSRLDTADQVNPVRRRIRIPDAGAVIATLAAALTLAVAGGAIVLLGHRHRGRPSAGTTAAIPPDARDLARMLAVLRRPQTAQDRSLRLTAALLTGPVGLGKYMVPSLTRLAWSSNGFRVFLVIARPNPRVENPRDGDRVIRFFVAADGQLVGGGGEASASDIRTGHTLGTGGVRPGEGGIPGTGRARVDMIVPDGVARVRLRFAAHGTLAGPDYVPPLTVEVPVSGNVAVIRTPRPPSDLPVVITWLTADGHVTRIIRGQTAPIVSGPTALTINLRAPSTGTAAAGTALILWSIETGGYELSVMADGIKPNSAHDAYAVWLFKPPRHARMLGFVNPPVGRTRHLSTEGTLPPSLSQYDELLVTRETKPQPQQPGQIVLQGSLAGLHR